mmetsp:Transcript_2422/g.7742  ORF Transcript_2422/g.7742 Transcript_2422/m.7742 type:complete len:260 (+) Transcript_2422:146-925(+)
MPVPCHPLPKAGFFHDASLFPSSASRSINRSYVSNFSKASLATSRKPSLVTFFLPFLLASFKPSSNNFSAYNTSMLGGALGSFTHEYMRHNLSSALLKSGVKKFEIASDFFGASFHKSSSPRAKSDLMPPFKYRFAPSAISQKFPSSFSCNALRMASRSAFDTTPENCRKSNSSSVTAAASSIPPVVPSASSRKLETIALNSLSTRRNRFLYVWSGCNVSLGFPPSFSSSASAFIIALGDINDVANTSAKEEKKNSRLR